MTGLHAMPKLQLGMAAAVLLLAIAGAAGCSLNFDFSTEYAWGELRQYDRFKRYHGPTWTADGQGIFFESYHQIERTLQGHGDNIFLVNSSGTELSIWEPEDGPGDGVEDNDVAHDLSPGTSRIAFATLRHGHFENVLEVATAKLDGSDYRRLTKSEGIDTSPSWSPDGSLIAFVSNRSAYESTDDDITVGYAGIYVMESNGKNVRSLAPSVLPNSGRAEWSPDGKWLAFSGITDPTLHPSDLYSVSADGTRVNNLGKAFPSATSTESYIRAWFPPRPAWSPDSQWLAYVVAPDSKSEAIAIASPDGNERREVIRLVRNTLVGNLSWSPDGSKIRFTTERELDSIYTKPAIYDIGMDGSDPRRISGVERGARIAWSPDDSKIAVSLLHTTTLRSGDTFIYTITADGSDKRVLAVYGPLGPEAADPK